MAYPEKSDLTAYKLVNTLAICQFFGKTRMGTEENFWQWSDTTTFTPEWERVYIWYSLNRIKRLTVQQPYGDMEGNKTGVGESDMKKMPIIT